MVQFVLNNLWAAVLPDGEFCQPEQRMQEEPGVSLARWSRLQSSLRSVPENSRLSVDLEGIQPLAMREIWLWFHFKFLRWTQKKLKWSLCVRLLAVWSDNETHLNLNVSQQTDTARTRTRWGLITETFWYRSMSVNLTRARLYFIIHLSPGNCLECLRYVKSDLLPYKTKGEKTTSVK